MLVRLQVTVSAREAGRVLGLTSTCPESALQLSGRLVSILYKQFLEEIAYNHTHRHKSKNTPVSNGQLVKYFNQGNDLNGFVVKSTWEQYRGDRRRFQSPLAAHQLFGFDLIKSTL